MLFVNDVVRLWRRVSQRRVRAHLHILPEKNTHPPPNHRRCYMIEPANNFIDRVAMNLDSEREVSTGSVVTHLPALAFTPSVKLV